MTIANFVYNTIALNWLGESAAITTGSKKSRSEIQLLLSARLKVQKIAAIVTV
jgi:hypothetical protein